MTVVVHVPAPLRDECGGESRLTVAGATVRDVLEELRRSHWTLYRNVCNETGAVRRHVNLFVNDDHVRDRDGLDTPLSPGDAISILPAVSGG